MMFRKSLTYYTVHREPLDDDDRRKLRALVLSDSFASLKKFIEGRKADVNEDLLNGYGQAHVDRINELSVLIGSLSLLARDS